MINLLPPQQKEELLLRERLNLILILSILISSFLICLALILFLVKIPIERDLEVEKIYIQEKEREYSQSKSLEEKIKVLNLTLSQLKSFYQNQISLTEILEKISQAISPGIYLTNLNFSAIEEKEEIGQISISGLSLTREDLLLFKKNLESEKDFFEIYFPPENWIHSRDIDFNISFKLR